MEGTNIIRIEDSNGTKTINSLEGIELLAKEDGRLQAVLNHMKKRGVSNILKEIKEILYVDDNEIYVEAIKALPYIYYNYVVFMDYYKDTMEYFDDLEVQGITGTTKEDLHLIISLPSNEVKTCTLKEFCDIVEPSCKYYTNVNYSADLEMPASITEDTVFNAIKRCLF